MTAECLVLGALTPCTPPSPGRSCRIPAASRGAAKYKSISNVLCSFRPAGIFPAGKGFSSNDLARLLNLHVQSWLGCNRSDDSIHWATCHTPTAATKELIKPCRDSENPRSATG